MLSGGIWIEAIIGVRNQVCQFSNTRMGNQGPLEVVKLSQINAKGQ